MDPLSLSVIPATLVGLLHTWKSERATPRDATLDNYLAWLDHHRHDQLVDLIQQNAGLARAIDGILRSNHDSVMASLARVESIVGSVAANLEALRPLGMILPRISEQAIAILRAMNEVGAKELLLLRTESNGCSLSCPDVLTPTNFPDLDQRLVEDDLDTMERMGLLSRRSNDLYYITRAGAAVGGDPGAEAGGH